MSNNDVNPNPYANGQFAPAQPASGAPAQSRFGKTKKLCRALLALTLGMSILLIASPFLPLVQEDREYATFQALGREANENHVWLLPTVLTIIALAVVLASYVIPKLKASIRRILAFAGATVFTGSLAFYLWATLAKVYTIAGYYSFTIPEFTDFFDMDMGFGFVVFILASVVAIIASVLLGLRYGKLEQLKEATTNDFGFNQHSVQPSYGAGIEGQGAYGSGLAGQTPYGSPVQTQAPYSPNPQPIATAPYYGGQPLGGTQQVSGSANTEAAYSPLASYGAYGAHAAPQQNATAPHSELDESAQHTAGGAVAHSREESIIENATENAQDRDFDGETKPASYTAGAPAEREAGALGDGANAEPVANLDVEEQAIADTYSPNEGRAFDHIRGNTYEI